MGVSILASDSLLETINVHYLHFRITRWERRCSTWLVDCYRSPICTGRINRFSIRIASDICSSSENIYRTDRQLCRVINFSRPTASVSRNLAYRCKNEAAQLNRSRLRPAQSEQRRALSRWQASPLRNPCRQRFRFLIMNHFATSYGVRVCLRWNSMTRARRWASSFSDWLDLS